MNTGASNLVHAPPNSPVPIAGRDVDEVRVVLEDAPAAFCRQVPEADLAQAERFLTLLDEDAGWFTFVTFDDDQTRKDRALTTELTGPFQQHAPELARLNRAGAGVFVTINATDGLGRKSENVTAVRAVFVDLDGAPLGPVLDCGLEPHLVVETSPQRYHAYWLVQGGQLDEFSAMQAAIAARFDGDGAVKDLPRVMRVPGFYHQKVKPAQGRASEPFLARVIHESGGQPLAWTAVRDAFPPASSIMPAAPDAPLSAVVVINPVTQRDLRSALAALRSDDRDVWVRMGMALKTLGDVGRGLWMEWSQTSDKYDPADAAQKWASFKPERTGYQAVFAEAQRHSWLNPQSAGASVPTMPLGGHVGQPLIRRGFELVHVAELLGDEAPHNWLIKGVLEKDSVGQVFGDPASGKSFLALDWSACIATGIEWCGRTVAQGAVIYIAGEGHHGIRRRLQAWAMHYGVGLHEAPLYVSKTPADLADPAGLQAVLDALAAHPNPLLVVIDTLARNLGAADENSTPDINRFIAHLDLIRGQTHATILVVHHSGHESKDRGRGSSVLRAAWDFEYRLARRDLGSELINTKAKDFEPPDSMVFEFQPIPLGYTDEDGQPVTSALLIPSETERRNVERRKSTLTNAQKIAMTALYQALAKHGQEPPAEVTANMTLPFAARVVEIEQWRKHAYAVGISDGEPDANRKAFQRARVGLQAKQRVGVWEEWAWPDDPDWVRCGADDSPAGCDSALPSEGQAGQGHGGTKRDIRPGCPPAAGTGRDTGLRACPAVPLGQDLYEHWDEYDEYDRMH